ncbi:MAG: DNA methyltransferase [Pseudomonadota bacterium]|nr:DNA methyltransferase [Pseudomonadota bacterium]
MSRPLAYAPENALNAICPYFTMFPLEYPLRVLKEHRNKRSVVMDPFCGRGTTLFAARKLGLESRGIDSSAVAVAIAKAKLAKVDVEQVLSLARTFIARHSRVSVPTTDFFRQAYHKDVLPAICAIRKGLLSTTAESDDIVVLRAAMLGCLHGPVNKVPDKRSYFSNQMPRTFAAKPAYAVKFWKERELRAPKVDVLSVLRHKLDRLSSFELGESKTSRARLGDSRYARSLPTSFRDFSVVVTSPPYYGMRTYVQDQWLRAWFLGGSEEVNYINEEQLQHTGTDVFAESLGQVWRNMARTTADSLDMYVRFGIIPSSKVDAKALVRSSLEHSGVKWNEVSVRAASTASSGKRQADHMAAVSAAALEYDFHVRRA